MSMARKLMSKAASSKASKSVDRSKAPQSATKGSAVKVKVASKPAAAGKKAVASKPAAARKMARSTAVASAAASLASSEATPVATKATAVRISPEQMKLPVSFDAEGHLVTLRQMMQPGAALALSMASLTPTKRAEITVKRIEAQPKFELAMVGAGVIDKARAIREVMAQSDIGRVLVEIEQRVIQSMLNRLANR